MQLNLQSLLSTYGWQIALVAFIGTVLTGLVKMLIKKIVASKSTSATSATDETASDEATTETTTTTSVANYDPLFVGIAIAFAALFSCLYTFLASKFGWIYEVADDGTKVYASITVTTYLENILGTYMFELLLFTIWNKLGAKKVWTLVKSALQKLYVKLFDKDGDGEVTSSELVSTITSAVSDGTISIEDVLKTVSEILPEVAEELVTSITEEAGDDATVSATDAVSSVASVAQTIVSNIPSEDLAEVASAIIEKVESVASEAAEEAVAAAATTSTLSATETTSTTKPQRPTINFT